MGVFKMLSIQRRNEIKIILLEKGNATVSEMAERFNVSHETIRRDFEVLEVEGFLIKAYGGAVLKKHVKSEVEYQVLEGLFLDNKQRIAKKAAEFIFPGDCIFMDYSTTVFQLLNEIKNQKLTIMTNSLKLLTGLAESSNMKIVATGGEFDPNNYSFSGRVAEKYITHYHLDKAFISCTALAMKNGLSDKNEREADIHRSMIENADSVYLLMDHTKFDKEAFVHTCDFEKITAIITDYYLSESWKNFLKARKIGFYECI
jgi:DeoR/GlpR family transcriptional regulator of sugar metabolism